MCGIAGLFSYDTRAAAVDPAELLAIRDHMLPRGPDGAGSWIDDAQRVGLAHRRLSIIDLSEAGSQPMMSADQRFIVTFNGEIYNYPALRRELEQAGRVFRSHSDTEILLHLYEMRGAEMLPMLRGMFAFAIWDRLERSLFLARDPYGIKPLYYSDDGRTLRFASQVKALLAGGAISRDECTAGWTGFWLFGSVPEPWTAYRAIKALPAGHSMLFTSAGAHAPKRYFSIAQALANAERGASDAGSSETQSTVRAHLLECVRDHLLADVPVGAFLSGGTDSGALVGLMRDAGQSDIQTMTLVFDEFAGRPDDEAPIAAQVARLYETRHTERRVDEREFQGDLDKIFEAMDQPTIDGVNTWFTAKAARELGLKVVLSGLGGDELFGGYPSFHEIPKSVAWLRATAGAPALGRAVRKTLSGFDTSRLGLNAKAKGILEYGGTFPGSYLLKRGLFMPYELPRVMDPELQPSPSRPFAKVSALESSLYMRNQLLRDTDWTSMAHSLEARVPLVDARLLEQVAKLPLDQPEFERKALLRLAPTKALPRIIGEKPKTGFLTPIKTWISNVSTISSDRLGGKLDNEHWSRKWAMEVQRRYA
jgi:asparagine synthase (glutamine-hydrolysing)